MENLHGKVFEEGKEAIEEHVHVTAEVIFEVSSVGLLCFVSLCLNAVVLITLYRTPRLHNSFNLLVVNLAANGYLQHPILDPYCSIFIDAQTHW